MINSCIYFVEGACEEKLINALKEPPEKLLPGKVRVLNVIQNEIPRSILLAIRHGTKVVLVFDTDVPYTEQLKKNLVHLKKYCSGIKVLRSPSIPFFIHFVRGFAAWAVLSPWKSRERKSRSTR